MYFWSYLEDSSNTTRSWSMHRSPKGRISKRCLLFFIHVERSGFFCKCERLLLLSLALSRSILGPALIPNLQVTWRFWSYYCSITKLWKTDFCCSKHDVQAIPLKIVWNYLKLFEWIRRIRICSINQILKHKQ